MRKFFLYSLYLLLSTLILLEIGVRLWGIAKGDIYDPVFVRGENPEIPFILKPNLHNATGPGNSKIDTDDLGLRSLHSGRRPGAKGPHEYRIAFLGDSFTFGQGVSNEEVFTQVIADELNQWQSHYTVKVFNFGVTSYNVKNMVDTFQYRALSLKPDLAVMCIIYNDFDLNRTGVVDEDGYLVNPHGWGRSWIGSNVKRLVRHLHLFYAIKNIVIHVFWPDYAWRAEADKEIAPTYRYVRQFRDIAEAHGVNYLIVTLPSKLPSDARISEIEKQMGKDGLKYYPLFSLAASFNLQDFSVNKWDPHPSALVHQKIAESLGRYLLDNYLKVGPGS